MNTIASDPSYGIILFTMVNNTPKFLIQQRRDTYEYMDIIRGTYNTDTRLVELLKCISIDEKNRIMNYTFEELWIDIWLTPDSIHRKDYGGARKKYEQSKPKLQDFLMESNDSDFYLEPPWGFPKGKKRKKENDIKCALREFEEETLLPASSIKIWNVDPFIEHYKGNNHRYYNTTYFLAESPKLLNIVYTPTPRIIRTHKISNEAGDLKWVSLKEASQLLNSRRASLLLSVKKFIDITYYQDGAVNPIRKK